VRLRGIPTLSPWRQSSRYEDQIRGQKLQGDLHLAEGQVGASTIHLLSVKERSGPRNAPFNLSLE
jgi:hypothetical protein